MRKGLTLGVLTALVATSVWLLATSGEFGDIRRPLDLPVALAEGPVQFYGFETTQSFVWCIDRSCSMAWSGEFDALRTEIFATLDQLTPTNQFSIVAFNNTVGVWSSTLVDATPASIESAISYLASIAPSGGTCLATGLISALDVAESATGDVSILLAGDGPDACGASSLTPQQLVNAITPSNPNQIPIHCFDVGNASASQGPATTYQALADAFGGEFPGAVPTPPDPPGPWFVRGDANDDGVVQVSDAVVSLEYLFLGGTASCRDALDCNDDGALDLTDPILLLGLLFGGSTGPLPSPYPGCGKDPTCDLIDCIGPVNTCPPFEFSPSSFSGPPIVFAAVAEGDFNGDGLPDLATGDGNTLTLLVGTGTSTLTPGSSLPLPSSFDRMVAGDLNNDGALDLVMTNFSGGSDLMVATGNGDGTFALVPQSASTASVDWPDLGDFDNDGNLDVVASSLSTQSLIVRLGGGDGTFGTPTSYPSFAGNFLVPFARDFNNDGNIDIASVPPSTDELVVRLGDGTGSFGPQIVTDTGLSGLTYGFHFGDMDDDGILDLVTVPFGLPKIRVFRGMGDGTFTQVFSRGRPFDEGLVYRVEMGDLNGDGTLDVAYTTEDALHAYLGDGAGSLSSYGSFPAPQDGLNSVLRLVDLDLDSDLDVVLGSTTGTVEMGINLTIP